MKITELRELTTKKLHERLTKLKGELRETEFDIRIGQEKDNASRGKKRKEVARILTILNEGIDMKEEKVVAEVSEEKPAKKEEMEKEVKKTKEVKTEKKTKAKKTE